MTASDIGTEAEKDARAIYMIEAAMNVADMYKRSRTEIHTHTLRRLIELAKRGAKHLEMPGRVTEFSNLDDMLASISTDTKGTTK